ncbi:rare lipoprotein A [Spirochaeta thermophila DSM 6578]|uniref:Probable endolytic peptidoglycan transglycosylase RlpA n=1 Tax=Winmispira thermophila (strain ATCC 700085 / DSM 6578 / Z-1203) TaxID=869211 RepID=G0GAM7_WINT7|nr:septal ring lytic transglycosylase RlpA family protein [Spirochaeta thermophila]AEJ60992.1 rare lipoprotein A [Spirochaeta thermophila DSM 6578]
MRRVLFLLVFSATLMAESWHEEGLASWYGPGFAGKLTASGEVYNPEEMTAAHKSLPFGALVRVWCRETGHAVVVRITDRGPFVEGRVIDLSRRAAEMLGFLEEGTAHVKVELLAKEGLPQGGEGERVVYLQVGAFRKEANALRLGVRLAEEGVWPEVHRGEDGVYRVVVAAQEEEEARRRLEGMGLLAVRWKPR